MTILHLRNFADVKDASLEFGELTAIVGAQGTGKSLALRRLKTTLDGKQVGKAPRDADQNVSKTGSLVDLSFGVEMGSTWTDASSITLDEKPIRPANIARRSGSKKQIFFIPAHRAMLIMRRVGRAIQQLNAETPVVARLFSQNLFDRLSPATTPDCSRSIGS